MKQTNIFSIVAIMLLQLAIATNLSASDSIDSLAEQKSYFYSAKEEINNMLSGKIPLDYERAIFIIENAYWDNIIEYSRFQSVLDFHTKNIKRVMFANKKDSLQNFKPTLLETEEMKKAKYEKALANWSIFTYMTNTTFFALDKGLYSHLPYNYSTIDPLGTMDWTNTQVFNLIDNQKGNCFALVSLFKIFSERLNSEANVCTAPGHIYIRHADNKGIYLNVELSSRSFPGTGSMEVLTYTTDEGTKNGISLRELDLKKSIALCLVYLAKGYEYKFKTKNDDFILQCAELTLQNDSLNLNAMLLKSEWLEEKIIKKNKAVAQLQTDKDFIKYEKLITHLYKLGYREMPLEMKNIIIAGLKQDTFPIIVKDHTPQPFKDLGVKDSRYATLSGGIFDEMHEEKPFEQYSRTEFDTKKRKISKFVKADILYNQYNFDPVVFAWNVDPLAKHYVPISPYAFALNNPIYFVDKDGRVVYGLDGKPVTINKDNAGNYVINGKPDAHTNKLFSAMIKTPKGAESAIGYTTSKDEFRFTEKTEVIDIQTNSSVHGETFPADEKGNRLAEETDPNFHYFQVDYTTASIKDRMDTWSEEEKLNVIGTHEKAHEKRGLLIDKRDTRGVAISAELESRFQYSILNPESSSEMSNWLENYNTKLGYNDVNKAYSKAVGGLIESGKVTKDAGQKMIEDFTKTNVAK